MAFTFPTDKADFTAPNGITYSWDTTDEKWVVKAYEIRAINDIGEEVSDLAQRITDGEEKQNDLDGRVSRGESAQVQIAEQVLANKDDLGELENEVDDALQKQSEIEGEVIQLKNEVDMLSVTKGSVAKYECKGVSINVATRNGELYVSSPVAADVVMVSFAPYDLNGQPTKPCSVGDIIEFVEAAARSVGQVTRYRIVSGDSNSLSVEYLSGENNFEVGEKEEVYIYPQNEEGATKDYVDAQDETRVKKAGDIMTGSLAFNRGNKANSQFRITPNQSDHATNIYSLNNGEMRLRTSHTGNEGDRQGSHIVLKPNDGIPSTEIFHVVEPRSGQMAANKSYVDTQDDGVKAYVDEAVGSVDLSGYLPLTGGEMTGGIEIDKDGGTGLIIKKDGTSNLKLWADGSAETTKTTFSDNHYVTKSYVDTQIDNIDLGSVDLDGYLPLAGGTMTGELNINIGNASNAIRLQQNGVNKVKLWNTNSEARLEVYNGQVFKVIGHVNNTVTQLFGVSNTGTVTLSNLRTPTSSRDAATKEYVESLIAAPAKLSWKWDAGSTGDSAPPTGAFKYTTNGSDHYYRLSFETYQGIKLGESVISEFNREISYGPVGTIWYKEANGWKFKQQFRIDTFRWNYHGHFEFRVTSRNGSTTFTPGTPYYITIGGFF